MEDEIDILEQEKEYQAEMEEQIKEDLARMESEQRQDWMAGYRH